MTHLISANNGAGSTEPLAVAGYETKRDSRNIIHDTLDGSIGVSYIAPRPRNSTLALVYDDRAEAWAAYVLLSEPTSFTYSGADVPEAGMIFALDGSLDIAQDDDVAGIWYVDVGYQELS